MDNENLLEHKYSEGEESAITRNTAHHDDNQLQEGNKMKKACEATKLQSPGNKTTKSAITGNTAHHDDHQPQETNKMKKACTCKTKHWKQDCATHQ